jgi:hypothetical protein
MLKIDSLAGSSQVGGMLGWVAAPNHHLLQPLTNILSPRVVAVCSKLSCTLAAFTTMFFLVLVAHTVLVKVTALYVTAVDFADGCSLFYTTACQGPCHMAIQLQEEGGERPFSITLVSMLLAYLEG